MASLGMVFEGYPEDVICYVTDPKTGIQRRSKWPPTISEIVDAMDDRMADLKRQDRFRNWGKNDQMLIEGPRSERPTIEKLKAKYGENWGMDVPEKRTGTHGHPVPTWDEIAKTYSENPALIQALTKRGDDESN